MKIIIIIGSFKTGGAERMSINTGEGLIKKGHDVYYLVQRPIFEIPNSISEDRIIVLRNNERTDFIYKISSLFFGVYQISKKLKPDVVIGFSRFSSFLACFTFCKHIIARFDMNPYNLSLKQKFWANYVINFPFVRKIVVPSSGMLAALSKRKRNHISKFIVIPNSVKKNTVLENARKNGVKIDSPYIASMGRLSSQKNFELLIEAYSQSSIIEKYKLLIIGEGHLKSKLLKDVERKNLANRILFTGQLSNPYPTVANSSFFVNSSSHESFCNVILEALTLSKPVIATDCDYGPSDMVINGENGFLIENDNLSQLIERLNSLGHNESLQNKFSRNAQNSIEKFELSRIVEKWMNVISDIN